MRAKRSAAAAFPSDGRKRRRLRGPCHLVAIPAEMRIEILAFLELRDLSCVRATCRRLRDAVDGEGGTLHDGAWRRQLPDEVREGLRGRDNHARALRLLLLHKQRVVGFHVAACVRFRTRTEWVREAHQSPALLRLVCDGGGGAELEVDLDLHAFGSECGGFTRNGQGVDDVRFEVLVGHRFHRSYDKAALEFAPLRCVRRSAPVTEKAFWEDSGPHEFQLYVPPPMWKWWESAVCRVERLRIDPEFSVDLLLKTSGNGINPFAPRLLSFERLHLR